jgi:hypothetical protein
MHVSRFCSDSNNTGIAVSCTTFWPPKEQRYRANFGKCPTPKRPQAQKRKRHARDRDKARVAAKVGKMAKAKSLIPI